MEREIERVLPVRLTTGVLEERGRMLAEKCDRYGKIEAEKKEANAAFKEELDECRQEMSQLARVVSAKHEQRPVMCRWSYDYQRGQKTLIRRDTGEVVVVEPITAAELQIAMDVTREGEQTSLPT